MTESKWRIFKKFDAPTTVFFAITIISVGFLVLPLWNYTKFYSALWNFDYVVSSVTIDTSQVEAIQINVTLLVTNPTDYSGLEVSSVMVKLQYFSVEHEVFIPEAGYAMRPVMTNWWDLEVLSDTVKHQVSSNMNGTILLQIIVNPHSGTTAEQDIAWGFINFVQAKQRAHEPVKWLLSCRLVLFSFLGGFSVSRYFTYVSPLD